MMIHEELVSDLKVDMKEEKKVDKRGTFPRTQCIECELWGGHHKHTCSQKKPKVDGGKEPSHRLLKKDGLIHVSYLEEELKRYNRIMKNPSSEVCYMNDTIEHLKKNGHGNISILYGTPQYSASDEESKKIVQIEGEFAEKLAEIYNGITQIIVGNSRSPEKAKSKADEWRKHKMITKSVTERAIDKENFEEIIKEWQVQYRGQKVDVFFMMSGETKGYDEVYRRIQPEGIRMFVMTKIGSYGMKLEVWQ